MKNAGLYILRSLAAANVSVVYAIQINAHSLDDDLCVHL